MVADHHVFSASTTSGTGGGFQWFLVRNHPVLSTRFRRVVLSTGGTMVLSSKEEVGELRYCSPHFFSRDGVTPRREEGGP